MASSNGNVFALGGQPTAELKPVGIVETLACLEYVSNKAMDRRIDLLRRKCLDNIRGGFAFPGAIPKMG